MWLAGFVAGWMCGWMVGLVGGAHQPVMCCLPLHPSHPTASCHFLCSLQKLAGEILAAWAFLRPGHSAEALRLLQETMVGGLVDMSAVVAVGGDGCCEDTCPHVPAGRH